MDLWRSLNGMVKVEILTADPAVALADLHQKGITLEHVHVLDELTIQFQIRRQDLISVRQSAAKRGAQLKIKDNKGFYWKFRSFLRRPVLVFGLLSLLLLNLFVPTRLYFFRVDGNISVPTNHILEVASKQGISFGVSRREIRSEKVKNVLLQEIPELEWVGINTSGCVATISVRERQTGAPIPNMKGVSSIVATREGVVENITVTSGSAVVKTGQAVKAGQVLISGYTDCGISIRASRANGEIYARTQRVMSFVLPQNSLKRGEQVSQIKKYGIIVGKKRINFYKDSGILDTSCVKMYEENYVTLPGGFQLPVAFVTETYIYYEEITPIAALEHEKDNFSRFAESYLRDQMIAGKVLEKNEVFTEEDSGFCLDGMYQCLEMIGRERTEEIIGP